MDGDNPFPYFSASAAPGFTLCPRRHFGGGGKGSPPSVSQLVGSAVHARLLGEPFEAPDRMSFDGTTPSMDHFRRQVDVMSGAAEEFFRRSGMAPEAREKPLAVDAIGEDGAVQCRVNGRLDGIYRAGGEGGFRVLVDLKTGARRPSNWPQLAVYAWMASVHGLGLEQAMVVWLPRRRDFRCDVEAYDRAGTAFGQLAQDGRAIVDAWCWERNRNLPSARPGAQVCSGCSLRCALRAETRGINDVRNV